MRRGQRAARSEFALAHRHIERGPAVYDPDRHASSAFVYAGHDAGVCARSGGALLSWLLGYPERALHLAREGVALAAHVGHPISMAQALCYKAIAVTTGPMALAREQELRAHRRHFFPDDKLWSQIDRYATAEGLAPEEWVLRVVTQALSEGD
jgi:hypothetical protein